MARTCRVCAAPVGAADDTCPKCGASLEVAGGDAPPPEPEVGHSGVSAVEESGEAQSPREGAGTPAMGQNLPGPILSSDGDGFAFKPSDAPAFVPTEPPESQSGAADEHDHTEISIAVPELHEPPEVRVMFRPFDRVDPSLLVRLKSGYHGRPEPGS